jgi:hypothetical protein
MAMIVERLDEGIGDEGRRAFVEAAGAAYAATDD